MTLKKQQYALLFLIFILLITLTVGIFDKFDYLRVLPSNTSPLDEYSQGTTTSEKVFVPDFTITNFSGIEIDFFNLKEKPIVMIFWDANVEGAANELEKYQNILLEYNSRCTFIFLNCNSETYELQESSLEFLQNNDLPFINTYFDTTGDAARLFGITNFPTTAFIDDTGFLVSGIIGETDYEMLKLHLDNITN